MSGIPARVREDFPRARTMAYFDNASSHPISVRSAAALHRYVDWVTHEVCLLYTSPSPRDGLLSRMPSSA